MFGVSPSTVYRALKALHQPKGLRRADRGKPRDLPEQDMVRYCEIIAALKMRARNKKGRHLSTNRAIELLEDHGVTTPEGHVQPHKGVLKSPTVNRWLRTWGLGSLAGASWAKVMVAGPLILMASGVALSLGRGLNSIALGEATAHHIGIPVQRMKNTAILTVAGATGAAVAVSGGIEFIGIMVPHLLRLWTGPDHRGLLLNAALLGASLLLLADMISRVVVAPAELPIGIVTAILGAPVFLWIPLRRRGMVDM